jgi:hypothetical protein
MEKENINATTGTNFAANTHKRANFGAILGSLHGRRHVVLSSYSLKHSLEKTDEMLCVVRKRRRGSSDRPESSHASVCSQSHTFMPPPSPLYVYRRGVKYDGREAGGTFTEMRGLSHLQIGNFGTESAENSVK